MITNLAVALGCLSTLTLPDVSRMMLTGRGLDVRNHSTLELLMVALAILLVYATFERWSLRKRIPTNDTAAPLENATVQAERQDDDRHAA